MNSYQYVIECVNQITYGKEDIITPDPKGEENYKKASFMVNRTLGKHMDCLFQANEMNLYHKIDSTLKYQYLINSIRKKKRYGIKDPKADKSEYVAAIKEYYGYSEEKARAVLKLLTDEQLIELKKKVYKGGTRR